MTVVYFFRKKMPFRHSIEELFHYIGNNLPGKAKISNYNVQYQGKNLIKLLYNSWEVIFNQKDINHITGDIHYITIFLSKKKTILTIHDIRSIIEGQRLKRMYMKLVWFYIPVKMVRIITVISEFTRRELLKHVKIDPSKIVVIPNCVSPLIEYQPKQFNKQKPIILQIGTKEHKNLLNLIRAIKELDCLLIIIGNLTEHQKALLEKYKINYQDHYNIDFQEVIALYEKADIITFISTYEGFGLPIIEANAIGRAVITSNISPMPEVANGAALLVNPYSIEQIRDAVVTLISNDKIRDELIKKGLKNVKRFQTDVIANKYYELYQKIIDNNRKD